MEDYQVYVLGPDGLISSRIDIRCKSKTEARRLAEMAVGRYERPVELWQVERFVDRFEPGWC
jgi:hypothetical protein